MSRDPYKTVTGFVLLTGAEESESLGKATFLPETEWAIFGRGVRPITLEEIKKAARNLSGEEAAQFGALQMLKKALESRDQLTLREAMERMERIYRMREENLRNDRAKCGRPLKNEMFRGDINRSFYKDWAALLGKTPEAVFRFVNGLRPGPEAEKNPAILLSYEISRAVSSVDWLWASGSRKAPDEYARVVLWLFDGKFIPAIFCQNIRVALYIHAFFLAPAGEASFRICPKCGKQFFQKRANQDYCCPPHREAHRVARLRDKQRQKLIEQRKDEKKYGTQKAR